MTEINNNNINIQKNVAQPDLKTQKDSNVSDKIKESNIDFIVKEYKEAAAAPGAEAAGRAMVMINKADNTENDVKKIINNPQILNDSEALFNAAEKAGVPYPAAASFATSELA